jgi:hypothetical protein
VILRAAVLFISAACDDASAPDASAPRKSASARAKPVDHLAPGELKQGKERAFGLVLPEGMKVISRFDDAVHARGRFPPQDIANYVRKQVHVKRVELGAARTIFPHARIQGGSPERQYRIEVVNLGRGETKLEVFDTTPPPNTRGLTEAERWRRAGFNPDGTPIDPNDLE